MKKILLLLLNPWALAIPFTILVILFLPPVPKYKATIISREYLPGTCFFFTNLNGDSITEKIGITENSLRNASLKLYDPDGGLIDQVNFRHKLTSFPPNLSFGDFDHNGFQEIFLFTVSEDSIFLGFIEPLGPDKFITHERFIDRAGTIMDTIDFTASSGPGLLKDMNQDGFADLVFFISARYSIAPRQVYVYDIHQDTIWRSGSFGSNLNNLKIADINGDGFPEVVGDNRTWGNTRNSMHLQYGDSSAWLMVYDHNLKFLFEPVEFPAYGAQLKVQPFLTEDTGFIAVLYRNMGVKKEPPAIILFNTEGRVVKRRDFPLSEKYVLTDLFTSDPGAYGNLYLSYKGSRVEQIDRKLETIKSINLEGIKSGPAFYADLDKDRSAEIVFITNDLSHLVITRSDLSHPFELTFEAQLGAPRFSLKADRDHNVQLSVQLQNTLCLIDYGPNRLYWYRGVLYLLIYIGILSFILLVRRLQQIQIQRRRAAERELLELQLLTIRNQVDPHFTFNALNAINSLILKEKKEDAYRFASKLSHLMRFALENSDKITTSVREELDFIQNYLDLQKVRFRDSFDYRISVDERIDPAYPIPRHILQTYVENAVKHGLRELPSGGYLWIDVSRKDDHLLLSVRDNGVGRSAASAHSGESTGRGLVIMKQIFSLYERLYHIAIEQEIVDLRDESGKPGGTEVRIRVPVK